MEFKIEGSQFDGLLFIDAGYCLPEYRDDPKGKAPDSVWLLGLSEKEHDRLKNEARAYLRKTISFLQHDSDVDFSLDFIDYSKKPYDFKHSLTGLPILRVRLTGELLTLEGEFSARWNDADVVLLTTVFKKAAGGEQKAGDTIQITAGSPVELGIWVSNKKVQTADSYAPEVVINSTKTPWLAFVKIGFNHIFPNGLDHILFIVGIFLYRPQWQKLLYQSLIFTLAHSVTLAFSLLGLVSFSGKWVEVLIALSLVYLAIENIQKQDLYIRRLVLILLFGLLHGLGFGAMLNTYMPKQDILLPMAGFNLGVELGQICVLLVCYLLTYKFVTKFKWMRLIGSYFIGAFGIFWMFERIFFA